MHGTDTEALIDDKLFVGKRPTTNWLDTNKGLEKFTADVLFSF